MSFLDRPQIGPTLEEMGGEGVPEGMRIEGAPVGQRPPLEHPASVPGSSALDPAG